jgi:hypothetical protein
LICLFMEDFGSDGQMWNPLGKCVFYLCSLPNKGIKMKSIVLVWNYGVHLQL